MVAGTKYAILVSQGQSGQAEWNGACGNPYGPGEALILDVAAWETIATDFPKVCTSNNDSTSNAETNSEFDFAFQTYITPPAPTPAPTPASNSLLVKFGFIAVSFASYFSISMAPYTEIFGRDNSAPPASWGTHFSSVGESISGLTRRADLCGSFT